MDDPNIRTVHYRGSQWQDMRADYHADYNVRGGYDAQ